MFRWRSMVEDPPFHTGRYCVGHSGAVYKDAYYWTPEDAAKVNGRHKGGRHVEAGWSQLPEWGPTHWLDGPDIPRDGAPRVMVKMAKVARTAAPPPKRGVLARLFGRQ